MHFLSEIPSLELRTPRQIPVSPGFSARDHRPSPLVLPTSDARVTRSTLNDSALASTGTPAHVKMLKARGPQPHSASVPENDLSKLVKIVCSPPKLPFFFEISSDSAASFCVN
jgi:hypothetical protein